MKTKESREHKVLRYLAEHRLVIVSVHGNDVAATCRSEYASPAQTPPIMRFSADRCNFFVMSSTSSSPA